MSEAKLQLHSFFPYRLSVLNATVSETIAQLYTGRFQLTPQAWRILAVLGEHGVLSAKEAAEMTRMEKMQVSRAISFLKEHSLATQAADPQDRRVSRVRLTPAGIKLYQQIIPLVTEREHQLLSVLDAAEQTQLLSLMQRIEARAQEVAQQTTENV